MAYNNEMKACEGDCRAEVPEPTMADLMKEASVAAADALCIARRINSFLTAETDDCCEVEKDPACFRDELLKTRYTLFRLNNELHKMAHHLGTL